MNVLESEFEEYVQMMKQSFSWIEKHSKGFPDMAMFLQAWWANEMKDAIQNVAYRTWEITDRSRRLGRPWSSLPDIREEARDHLSRHCAFCEGRQEVAGQQTQGNGSGVFQWHLAQLTIED